MVLLQLGLKANRLTLAAEGLHDFTSKPVIWILHKMHPNIMVNCFCLLMNTAVGYIALLIYAPLLSAGWPRSGSLWHIQVLSPPPPMISART